MTTVSAGAPFLTLASTLRQKTCRYVDATLTLASDATSEPTGRAESDFQALQILRHVGARGASGAIGCRQRARALGRGDVDGGRRAGVRTFVRETCVLVFHGETWYNIAVRISIGNFDRAEAPIFLWRDPRRGGSKRLAESARKCALRAVPLAGDFFKFTLRFRGQAWYDPQRD